MTLPLVSILGFLEPLVQCFGATLPEKENHLVLPVEKLFHGVLDMSLHSICIRGKEAPTPYRHVCLGIVAYHMPTHVKNLSRHKISTGSVRQE